MPAAKTAKKEAAPLATPEQCAFALLIQERLCKEYECPIPYFHRLDPVSELVSSLLSHRTKNADSGRAFRNLMGKWNGDWQAVRDAPTSHVQEAISPLHMARTKSPAFAGRSAKSGRVARWRFEP